MAACPLIACCLAAFLLASATAAGTVQSATAKMERIETDRVAPGTIITLTADELLAYANEQAHIIAPGALRETTLTLRPAHAETFTMMNLLRVRQAEGHSDSWLAQQFLDGERPLRIAVRFQSANGRARVDVERVEVAGVPVTGATLDFLLRQFVIPNFPDARIGVWFDLGHHIQRLDVERDLVHVVVGK